MGSHLGGCLKNVFKHHRTRFGLGQHWCFVAFCWQWLFVLLIVFAASLMVQSVTFFMFVSCLYRLSFTNWLGLQIWVGGNLTYFLHV